MKKIIQILLLFAIILSFYIIFKIYFLNNKNNLSLEERYKLNQISNEGENLNTIENLRYEINLNENQKYLLNASKSEIYFENDTELVKMEEVDATLLDKTNLPIKIRSKYGFYNSSNNNTEFKEDIQIDYLDKKITAGLISINFKNNTIIITENVVLTTANTELKADNLNINLITKKN